MKTELRQPFRTFFGTLDNQIRIDIIYLLIKGSKNATQISKSLKLKQSTVSKNMTRLVHCGFVFVKHDGKECYYSVNKKTIAPIIKMMNNHMKNYCSKIAKCENC
jgi:predicted transcriptional regulator